MHTKDARLHGETEQRIYALNGWREPPEEQAALAFTEAIFGSVRRKMPFAQYGTAIVVIHALQFGIYNHFILITPDYMSQVALEGWGVIFQVTAMLLVITEGLGWGVVKISW